MKIREWYAHSATRSLDMHRRFQRGQGHAHIGRIRRDAVFARAEDGQTTVDSGDGRAARAGLALVARHIGSAEIHAPSSLQQIASGGRHVPKLHRCAAQNRFG